MGKTVTTYLVDGNPKGTRYAFISNKTCQVFMVPRSDLTYLNKQEKLHKPAFYILLGENELGKPKGYIGETENFRERIKDHDSKKDFWQKALIFVAKDEAMTKADVQYLEYLAIQEAKKANTFVLSDNKQTPKLPNLPEHQMDTMQEFFVDIKFLTSFMGCNIFEITEEKEKHLFYLNSRGSIAKGFYDESGFTVLKGSIIEFSSAPSFQRKERREQLISEYTSKADGKFILNTDVIFSSPSSAAIFCMGTNSNGWISWKDKKGRTLDEIYRQELNDY